MLPRPINDYLIVERPRAPQLTESGLHIPVQAQKKQTRGVVLAVGPGRKNKRGKRIAMHVKEGDIVLFRQYDVRKIFWPPGARRHAPGTRELVFLKEEELVGIVENECSPP